MMENYLVVIISVLICIEDVKTLKIPDRLLLLLCFILFVSDLIGDYRTIPVNLCSGMLMFFLFFFIRKGSGGGLGFGDVKFAAILGYLLGFFSAVYACLAATLLALSFFLILRAAGKVSRSENRVKLPFAPFMTAGLTLVLIAEAVGQ